MKKFISLMLCVCICLSSTAFCFGAVSDSQAASIVSDLSTIKTTLSNIYTRVGTIADRLYENGHSIAYWVEAICTWMSPIYNRINDILQATINPALSPIYNLLASSTEVDGVTQYTSHFIDSSGNSIGNLTSSILSYVNRIQGNIYKNGSYITTSYNSYGLATGSNNTAANNIFDAINNNLIALNNSNIQDHNDLFYYTKGYPFNIVNPSTAQTETFTPYSFGNALIRYLQKIQDPVARLGYVLASPERIEAQEKAADNEQAVVDNFIDSSGSGAASTSDFGSVSDLSSGFKNNISTDASVSGIWNIFNSDNFGWFSQETADQLDTTSSGQRTLRSSGNYPTPLLDQQTEDILKYIGGDDND